MTSNPYSTPMIARDSSLSNRSSKPSAIYHAYTLLIAHCVRLWSTVCCLILSICFPKRQQVLFGNNRLLIEYLGQFSTVVVAFHRSGSNYQFQILYLIGSGLIRVIHFYWSLFLAFLMEEEDGGYDADFVDNLDKDLECPVCMLALREPVLTHCGHHFCHSCTMKLMKSSSLALYACSKQTRFRFGKFDCPLDSQTCKEGDVSSCSELSRSRDIGLSSDFSRSKSRAKSSLLDGLLQSKSSWLLLERRTEKPSGNTACSF